MHSLCVLMGSALAAGLRWLLMRLGLGWRAAATADLTGPADAQRLALQAGAWGFGLTVLALLAKESALVEALAGHEGTLHLLRDPEYGWADCRGADDGGFVVP